MGTLEGRVAIVTGGGNGIGAAVARRFAAEGARVVINDLGASREGEGSDATPGQRIVEEIAAAGGEAVVDGGDIADLATGERLVELAVSRFGRLDIVVNAAGFLRDRMIFNMTEDDWDSVIRVHLKGHFSTARPASAYFREQRNPDGHYRIINFTSASGLHGSPGQANYAAAKLGIYGLTLSLAQGLARYGVTANAISPVAATRMTAEQGATGTPEDVAHVIEYIASERADWLTGRAISAMGPQIGLYNIPEQIASMRRDTEAGSSTFATDFENAFRPLADGLPPSPFNPQR
ncbi:SDR family NAD(P)-dependent oxidoreductase [Microbacterium sp. No. 7]|uniref:SDR family NAD(P)-dependent oxidoreductase n=1 Tax=Microbacterium sp. No. 7 TaxID=1714373 RepID=UPI0006CFE9D7|nr:SDR family NAD(P)-dependent oxidoreductase [Microbacterium sp. No. 7]ALJ21196.1 short-chain dehydrogenase [Microbacterium sp. No. 7]